VALNGFPYLYGDCKSDTLSPEVDFDPFFTPTWRIVCFGKCRCHPSRVKSLKDMGSSALIRGFITPTSAAPLGTIGAVTDGLPEASSFAPALAAFQLPIALMGRTTPASSICEPAFVTRLPTAYVAHWYQYTRDEPHSGQGFSPCLGQIWAQLSVGSANTSLAGPKTAMPNAARGSHFRLCEF
jgi:hypothetical protein